MNENLTESKQVKYNVEARDALKRGVDILANAVKVTLGPKGRNVIIDKKFGSPAITKDGVTVAKEIELKDALENMGAQMVKEVASKTADIAGDGTTTATVLAQAIVTAGIKNVAAGANPMDLKRGIDKAVATVVENLRAQSRTVESDSDLINIAKISSNGDEELGLIIADVVSKTGPNGIVSIEESNTADTTISIVDGLKFDRGYTSPHFINSASSMQVELTNVDILVTDKKISSMKDIVPILEKQVQTGNPLLIMCDDIEGEALATLVVNKLRNSLNVVAVRLPSYGDDKIESAIDIATITGATFICHEIGIGIESAKLSDLGKCNKVIIGKDFTKLIGGSGDRELIKKRSFQIKTQIGHSESELKKNQLKLRLAKIDGGVAVLYVGAATEVEMKEKKDRVDDALHATRAAVEEGIVAGGGVAFIRAVASLADLKGANEDENTGIQIIRRAIEEPLRQICENAGIEGSIVVQKVKEGTADFGYNARTNVYENLIGAGVIDPTKVTISAIQNASSVSSLLLTTECVISIN